MVKAKGKTEEEVEKEAQDEKPEDDEEAEEETEDDEEFEEIEINPGSTSSFRYPVLRRAAPAIRIQPITAPLEVELEDAPAPRENRGENADQYKPTPEKNYSLTQKYELPGSKSYEGIAPKQITQIGPPSSFRPPEGAGYPGQQQEERKYDSGLEQQTKEERDRRRNI